jgi:dolichol-phosphate mannosyltransferase
VKSVFFVPVFNQIQELGPLLDKLRTDVVGSTILLVNNGSDDGSEELIRNSGLPFLDLERNLGIGYSFIRAIEWALENGYDVFGSIAGNGKMLPSEMPRVLDPLLNDSADYVTGSRFLSGGDSPNLPRFRRSSIPMVNGFVKVLTGASLTDATCGYRAFRLEIIKKARFDWRAQWLYKYEFEYYLYAQVILSRRLRWLEVPITMRYPPPGQRYSKIKPFTGWYSMLKPWVVAAIDRKGFA